MRVAVKIEVDCSITNGELLLEMARRKVEVTKPPEERSMFYPRDAVAALEAIVRSAIAERLLTCGGIELHEIGHETIRKG